jgi:cation diffusion facilitator family transporter
VSKRLDGAAAGGRTEPSSGAHHPHDHVFLGRHHGDNERRTWAVVALTGVTMVAEIAAGTLFGSMALVADGWHMSTHAAALAVAALAYRFARRHAHDPHFSFGTGKLGELAAFASAILLALVAVLIGYESVMRLVAPVPIRFDEATIVAVIGLGVNLASAYLLAGGHRDSLADEAAHSHPHGPHAAGHDHHHHHHGAPHAHHHGDTNLRAATLHVLADALTSVLAIVALLAGRFQGWIWLDPLMGVVGAVVIVHWSVGLMRTAGAVLLDMVPSAPLAAAIRSRVEAQGDRVTDLHLWNLGPGHLGLVLCVASDEARSPDAYRALLADVPGLSHVTVEIHAPRAGAPAT